MTRDAGRTTVAASPAVPVAGIGREKIQDLDAYRGIAACSVVIFHVYQFCRPTGEYAYAGTLVGNVLVSLDGLVSMFLVLSAFVLYLPLARAVLTDRQPRTAGAFLARRAVRILPLYWIAVVAVWAYRNPSLPGDWRDLLEHITFTQVFDSKRIFYTIGPAWSLAVEVYFYLFLAGLHILARRQWLARLGMAGRLVALLAPAVLLIGASAAWQAWALWVSDQPATRWAFWFNPLAKGYMFGVGMILAVVLVCWNGHYWGFVRANGTRLAAAALYGWGSTIRTDEADRLVAYHALATMSSVLFLASSIFADPASRWRQVMSRRLLLLLGLVSYSVYMWHEPLLLLLDDHHLLSDAGGAFVLDSVVMLILSVGVGYFSYWAIEYPFGHLRSLRRPVDDQISEAHVTGSP